ncbi:MAG: asparagine--tRNA ligase [Desulfuromonadia bacterium]
MNGRVRISTLLKGGEPGSSVTVCGWVRSLRVTKGAAFMDLSDGSSLKGLQVVIDPSLEGYGEICRIGTGSAVRVTGRVVDSPAPGQRIEVAAASVLLVGEADETYPLQKKRHSFEYLRTIAHLRPRTTTFGAIFRIRSFLAQAIHRFFGDRGFLYVTTPIITTSDCEGAGELFTVTTLDPLGGDSAGKGRNYDDDFFGEHAHLTVSGQLEGELFALAFRDIYTFGPTFRAENSHTPRHAAEFWMIEPEMAFADLSDDRTLAEEFLRTLCREVLEGCPDEMEFFDRFIEPGVIHRIRSIADRPFEVMSYTEAIAHLQRAPLSFTFPVEWGLDLQTEHERYLTETVVGGPLFVIDYPKDIKAFYMRRNDDGTTVAAMDLLVPKVGEIIGGSQREERLDLLRERMLEVGIDPASLSWYLESRRWGSAPHAGFGLGFERLLMYLTGMENIRDVIPFPRTPGNARF